jgi:hypothetical protein
MPAEIEHNPWTDHQPEPPTTPPPKPDNVPPSRHALSAGAGRTSMRLLQRFNRGEQVDDVATGQLRNTLDIGLTKEEEKEVAGLLHDLENGDAETKRGALGKAVEFIDKLPESTQRLLDRLCNDAKQAKDAPVHHNAPAVHEAPATHASALAKFKPKTPSSIKKQIGELKEMEKEHAKLVAEADAGSPSAKIEAAELQMKMAEMVDQILTLMKMLAEISKRANQMAVQAI